MLNQPYGAFEWLGLPQKANTNWYNSHNFYGDLADIEAATIEDVKSFFDTYPETFRSTIAELSPAKVKNGAETLLGSADSVIVIVIVGDWAKVKDQLGAFKDITFLDINGRKVPPPTP